MDEGVSTIIGRIYQSVHDTRAFDAGLAAMLPRAGAQVALVVATGVVDSAFVGIQLFGDVKSRYADYIAEYQAELWPTDPTFAYLSANPQARFFDTALHRDRNAHLADPYLKWNRGFTGATHWMVCHSARAPGSSFGMALHPHDLSAPFGARERAEFQLFFEHVERAQRLATMPPDLAAAPDAVMVIDPQHRIVAISPAGEAVLAAADGLTRRGGVLTTSDPRQARALDRLVESALHAVARGGVGGEMLVERPSGRRPLALVVDPLPDQAELASYARGAIIRVVDPEDAAAPTSVARWRALWRLTPAETRAAAALVAHDFDLRAAADALGVTYATIRTQLAAIFAKTGTGSQPALMRLLTRVPG